MILSDYLKAVKMTEAKYRYDLIASTGSYDFFEILLVNKRGFNVNGHSFNCVPRPAKWNGRKSDLAITKGSFNITSVKRPNLESNAGYGDINGLNDGCIILFNHENGNGINTIEIFIARGLRNDTIGLWNLYSDGELDHEIETLRDNSKQLSINSNKK